MIHSHCSFYKLQNLKSASVVPGKSSTFSVEQDFFMRAKNSTTKTSTYITHTFRLSTFTQSHSHSLA
jgi:hypothetical protein